MLQLWMNVLHTLLRIQCLYLSSLFVCCPFLLHSWLSSWNHLTPEAKPTHPAFFLILCSSIATETDRKKGEENERKRVYQSINFIHRRMSCRWIWRREREEMESIPSYKWRATQATQKQQQQQMEMGRRSLPYWVSPIIQGWLSSLFPTPKESLPLYEHITIFLLSCFITRPLNLWVIIIVFFFFFFLMIWFFYIWWIRELGVAGWLENFEICGILLTPRAQRYRS